MSFIVIKVKAHCSVLCTYIQAIKAAEEHIIAVTVEWLYYCSICETSRNELKRVFTIAGSYQLPPPGALILPMSNNMTCYYSFDMAQQVNYYNQSYITMIRMLLGPLSV